MATTTATATKSSLIADVKQLMQEFNEQQTKTEKVQDEHEIQMAENRKKGCDELFEHLKSLTPDKIKAYAGHGRNEARIFEFKFKDEVKFGGCFAKDLLTKGDVVKRLQEFLDTEHAGDDGPAFLVYFTHIGRYQMDHTENKFGVFVNWNKDDWERIKERMAIQALHDAQPHGQGNDDESGGAVRGFGRGRGRGGFRTWAWWIRYPWRIHRSWWRIRCPWRICRSWRVRWR